MNQHLKVTINLSSPMVEPGGHFHLDALLGALRVQVARQEACSEVDPEVFHHEIPVARHTYPCGEWVFKASAFHLEHLAPTEIFMQTGRIHLPTVAQAREEGGWLKLRANKPNIGSGPLRNSLFHIPLLWATLTAYCVGNREGIEELLQECRQVGGRRGVGCGQVQSVVVEEIDEQDCAWEHRQLPVSSNLHDTHALSIGALRAPYWDRTAHMEVLTPV